MDTFSKEGLKGSSLPTYVLVHNLTWLTFFPLVKIYLKKGPFFVYYFSASAGGFRLISLLKPLRVFSRDPIELKEIRRVDTSSGQVWNTRYQVFSACSAQLKNIEKTTKKCFPFLNSSEIQFYSINVRKTWEAWLETLLLLRRTGKYLAHEKDLPLEQFVLVSPFASLIKFLELDQNSSEEISIVSQPFENKALPYLIGATCLSLARLLNKFRDLFLKPPIFSSSIKKESQNVGVEAAWNLSPQNQPNKYMLDDLFWYRKSTIPPKSIRYFYDRSEIQPTIERLEITSALGIKSIVLDPKCCGDAPELILKTPKPHKTVRRLLYDLLFSAKLLCVAFFSCERTRSFISIINWYYIKSEGLADIYRHLGIRALFYASESGFDVFSLAAKSADAIRIGFQWTCLLGMEGAVAARSHDVYFFWGPHDVKLALDSGCTSKHMLISGSFLTGRSNPQARYEAQSVVNDFHRRGVKYVLTLLTNSGESPIFYQFFAKWLLEDPKLGLLIKPKNSNNLSCLINYQTFTSSEDDCGDISQRVQDTQRIHILSEKISPADAALASDFSVGIGTISSSVAAALLGAKIFFMDFEQVDKGPQSQHTIFHSLGPNRCIFHDLEALKKEVLKYVANPKSNPYLGDVTPILNQLDSFCDRDASRRIAEFVEWYMEGLSLGLNRDESTLSATKKYAEKWGKDKVVRGL
jgi:hypothetical protein